MKKLRIKLTFEILVWLVLFAILNILLKDRTIITERIKIVLPNQQSSMLSAMILGDVSGISKEFYNQMIRTGLIHILVVSGSNLMIVTKGLIEMLSEWIGRKRAIILGLMMGWKYVDLVGWQIPATRAVVMVTVLYCSQFLGRKITWERMLVFVLLIMIVADYRVLMSISFWMSFLSFMAVSLNRNDNVLKTTIQVNLFLLPLLAWKFGSLSLIAPLSNLVTLFLVETITVLGFVGIFIQPILWLVYPLLFYIQKVVEFLSVPNWSQISVSFNMGMMMGCYLIIFGWILKKRHV